MKRNDLRFRGMAQQFAHHRPENGRLVDDYDRLSVAILLDIAWHAGFTNEKIEAVAEFMALVRDTAREVKRVKALEAVVEAAGRHLEDGHSGISPTSYAHLGPGESVLDLAVALASLDKLSKDGDK